MAAENHYEYKKFAVLYVDDEEKSLKYFTRAFEDQFRILTASNARDGLRLIEESPDDIGLLMTDQRMPGEQGVWLLERARHLRPRLVRVLVTAYADHNTVVRAVNNGSIYKYVTKPWDPPVLESTLRRGLEFFMVQRERDQLLREKMSSLQNKLVADRMVSLGLLAGGLSHHIRNSLTAVKTFLDLAPGKLHEEKLAPAQLHDPGFWRDYYYKVQNQIEKINTMLKDLWVASERPVFQFEPGLSLRAIAQEALDHLRENFAAKNIVAINEIPATLPTLTADRGKLGRLFELLLKDETVSLPAGSRVRVEASVPSGPSGGGQEITIRLVDDGPGLPPEVLHLLFDPFAIRADTPLEYGLNLMACYFIVHYHGGRIEAQNGPEGGTTFAIHLPTESAALPVGNNSEQFLQKMLLNDSLWERLLASD